MRVSMNYVLVCKWRCISVCRLLMHVNSLSFCNFMCLFIHHVHKNVLIYNICFQQFMNLQVLLQSHAGIQEWLIFKVWYIHSILYIHVYELINSIWISVHIHFHECACALLLYSSAVADSSLFVDWRSQIQISYSTMSLLHWASKETYHFFKTTLRKTHFISVNHLCTLYSVSKKKKRGKPGFDSKFVKI